VLRELNEARNEEDEGMPILAMDALKLMVAENEEDLLRRLASLMREDKVTPEVGTSLMNDHSYAFDISRYLIEVGETLFSDPNDEFTGVERQVALDGDELQVVLDAVDE
jgi:phosphate:Na+ symporter|tara:strand:- start:2120 stop:2446 length:327 start_codon:yes stop_codon:yes gene_type:complete